MQHEFLDVYVSGEYLMTIGKQNENDTLTVLRGMGITKGINIVPKGTDIEAAKKKLVSSDIKKAK